MFFKNKKEFSEEDKKYFIRNLNRLKMHHKEFEYLNKLNLYKIDYYWDQDMNTDNGTLGKYYKFSNNVHLAPYKHMKDLLIGTLVHELYHMYQRKKYGLFLYILGSIPFIRNFTIEPNAKKKELLYEDYSGKKIGGD